MLEGFAIIRNYPCCQQGRGRNSDSALGAPAEAKFSKAVSAIKKRKGKADPESDETGIIW